jgi:acetolactate synthase-1/2/3 large subunit
MQLTAGQIIGKALKAYGVPYVAGLPGHGKWSLMDSLHDAVSALPFIQVMHEHTAVAMVDAHDRVTGQSGCAMASIGPGASNTVIGLSTAHCDSTALLLITGSAATHMRAHGVMQEMDRSNDGSDFSRIVQPVTKRSFEVGRADQVPFVMHRAFNAMLSGRPGPVHMEIPLDVQVHSTDVNIAELTKRIPVGRPRADALAIEAAVKLLLAAERPVIVAGGGAITADASAELRRRAELLSIPVVFTWNGKGAFPEDHPLCAGTAGWPGSRPGNTLSATADVVLSLGCRFTDWSASCWRKGVTFSLPPGKLIQVDIDAREIGKNYPAEVGVVGDVKLVLADILAGISAAQANAAKAKRTAQLDELAQLKAAWEQTLAVRRHHAGSPTTMLRPLHALRQVLPRHGIVTVGSGHPQSSTKQAFPVFEPRTHITSGSFSAMGFAASAAIGAKLAKPDLPVVCIIGDGDFMQTVQELATCVMHDIPVVFMILNNKGYISIRDGQNWLMGRQIGSEFSARRGNNDPYSVDFVALAKSFGINAAGRVDDGADLGAVLKRAIDAKAPAGVEVSITRDASLAAAEVVGWWDFPILPTAPDPVRADYEAGLAAEQHLGATTDGPLAAPMAGVG